MNDKIEIDIQHILLALNLIPGLPYLVSGEYINHLIESDLKYPPPTLCKPHRFLDEMLT
ncbi:hypothetical protein [Paenibacillus sp. EPM92]|uniref:hypothetical protein n=1 Tax=Paenibacillus sp. EPM92 TaxID=1561195 RepID=UPI0019153547|nr:hypothetical protein [Paenibacillus sp. EPM92]